jgi:Xaa-Pro aminopeptidase
LARAPLLAAGQDFAHSTGHGVGAYGPVHQGPQLLGPRGGAPIEPCNLLSDEPGFYKEGPAGFGIRTENLAFVERRSDKKLGFAVLTLAPIDRRLIEPKLLTAVELRWLNQYHARVRKTLLQTGKLSKAEAAWLRRATRPL